MTQPPENFQLYSSKIERAKDLIASGDIYQVNLSQQICFEGERDPYDIFRKLAQKNPAPFSAYLKGKDFAIVSSSPERFLEKKGDYLETRPIKGTIPRGNNNVEDEHNRRELLSSEKEKAELLMITDLMRNDLSKISFPGSVETIDLWRCEPYTNVFHLLSIIRSHAKPNIHPVDLIRQCFPGGSITGCPKLRAMEVIAELEKRARGIYTGSIGYISANGDFDFNIAIRTLVFNAQRLDIQLGGAIVADSISEKEYQETLHKGKSIFNVLGEPKP
jgi:para-aminobenzoate synthetase component 1